MQWGEDWMPEVLGSWKSLRLRRLQGRKNAQETQQALFD